MNTKNQITRTVVVFAVLALAGISMAVGAEDLKDAFNQTVLITIGCSIFGASLAFFLIRIFGLLEK